jgi:hypothetical protein
MDAIEYLLENTDPLLRENVRARMIISAEIGDEIKKQGWDPKNFHQKCNAVIPSGESNISPMKVEKWLSGTHDFKISELIILRKVLGINWLKRINKRTGI